MKEPDTRARARHDRGMARPRALASAPETSRAVITGGGAKLPAESAREDFVAAEADIPGNQSHLSAARQKLACGALEPQAQGVLLRRFPEQLAKGPVEVERGPSGTVG